MTIGYGRSRRAVTYLGTLDAEDFAEDRKTQAAVERELAILGEAAKKIPESVRNAHPEVHWREMAGLREVGRWGSIVAHAHHIKKSGVRIVAH